MTLGFLFWLLMVLWLVFSAGWTWRGGPNGWSGPLLGGGLLLFCLLFILGWAQFGFVIKR